MSLHAACSMHWQCWHTLDLAKLAFSAYQSWMTQLLTWGLLFQFHSPLALKDMFLFGLYQQCRYYKWHIFFIVIMSVPIAQLTVEEAHKEFNSLADRTAAKYEQLDSSKFGAVGILAFNAKSAKLASLRQLCAGLNLPMLAQLHRLPFFRHWRALFRSKLQAGSLG